MVGLLVHPTGSDSSMSSRCNERTARERCLWPSLVAVLVLSAGCHLCTSHASLHLLGVFLSAIGVPTAYIISSHTEGSDANCRVCVVQPIVSNLPKSPNKDTEEALVKWRGHLRAVFVQRQR